MKKLQHLYIVWWREHGETNVGHLPFGQIPKRSILRKAIFSDEEITQVTGDICAALMGIYEKRKLAQAHLKIEREWRISTERETVFGIVKI